MKRITTGGILLLLSVLKLMLDAWGILDGLITKLRSKGSAGNLMADILVSRITVLILVVVGLGLLWTAIKELRAHKESKAELRDKEGNKAQVEHEEWVPLLPARERGRQAPIQIFNNPTIHQDSDPYSVTIGNYILKKAAANPFQDNGEPDCKLIVTRR